MICAKCGIEIDKKTMKCPKCGRPVGHAYAQHSSTDVEQSRAGGRSQVTETPSYELLCYVLPIGAMILCSILTVISILCFSKVTSALKENREEIQASITAVRNEIQTHNHIAPSLTVPSDSNISENPEGTTGPELTEHIIITVQPTSVLDAEPGSSVTLFIKAEGNDLEYQWLKLTENNRWEDPTQANYQSEHPPFLISPDDKSSLIINTSPEGAEGLYQCKVTSSSTSEVEYSEAVFLQYAIDPDSTAIQGDIR